VAALAYPVVPVVPRYRTGCKPGHAPLYFRGDAGVCFRCGREDPPERQLPMAQLVELARKGLDRGRDVDGTLKVGGLAVLEEAVAQTALMLRALAILEDVDIEDHDAYRAWLAGRGDMTATVDERLRAWDEDEVRWALKAAFV
jgi:hypothetical protein